MIRHILVALLAAFTLSAFAAIDANRATQAELETVKGIGPGLSAKILKARESGAFKGWPDMVERVPGVGSGNARKLSQAGLTVGGAAFDAAALPAQGKRVRKGAAEQPARKGSQKSGL